MNKLLPNIYNMYRDPGCSGFGRSYPLLRKAGSVLLPSRGADTTIAQKYAVIGTAN